MLKIKLSVNQYKYVIIISSTILIGIVILIWLNQSFSLENTEAEERIRRLLSRAVTNNYSHLFNDNNTLDYDTGLKLQQELREVNNLVISGIEIKKLAPGYLLRPHMPTYIVKTEIGSNGNLLIRYFWLSYSNIDRETSYTAWLFAL